MRNSYDPKGMNRQKIEKNARWHLLHNIRRNDVGKCRSSLPKNLISGPDTLANLDTGNGDSTLKGTLILTESV